MSDFDKWVGSGLADFVSKYRRPLMGTALGAIGGGLGGGLIGKLPTTGFSWGTGATYGGLLGGLAGGAAGYQRDEEKKAEEAALMDAIRQQTAKASAGEQLDQELEGFLPDPNAPDVPYTPPVAVNPGVDTPTQPAPVDGGYTSPAIDPGMGNIDVGGKAGPDVASILDEAERARQLQLDTLGQQDTMREQARTQMAELLNQQMERQFSDQMPGYLEDLNTRGLLRSSALGDRLSTERAKMAAGVNEQLALQGIQDQYGSIDKYGGIQDSYLQGRQGAMGRKFSLEDYARQIEASKLLGQATAPITPYSGGGKSGSAQAGMAGASLGLQAAGMGK